MGAHYTLLNALQKEDEKVAMPEKLLGVKSKSEFILPDCSNLCT